MGKCKYPPEVKIKACEDYLSGRYTLLQITERYNLCWNPNKKRPESLHDWIYQYKKCGPESFYTSPYNKTYSAELKRQAVEDYLAGMGSLMNITLKYDISSTRVLWGWIKKYNANIELKDYKPTREIYMAGAARKTTFDERKEIVKYCIDHDRDYSRTAVHYDVSYSQVYDWVRKYLAKGEDALIDKRGHHKRDGEIDELEQLRRENRKLKRRLEEHEMTIELLKKVRELERK